VERRRLVYASSPTYRGDAGEQSARAALRILAFEEDLSAKPYRTLRLNLEPSLEVLRRGLDQKWRNQLNSAEKNGSL